MSIQLTVGALARSTGVTAKTVRYYEEIGLLPEARRGENGYRYYPRETVDRVGFIQRAKLLGLSLAEIRELLAASDDGLCTEIAPELYQVLERKIAECDQQLRELAALRRTLAAAAERLAPCDDEPCEAPSCAADSPYFSDCACLPTVQPIVLHTTP
jgi:MerR family Zn(II)-responsive transcriptional regulator of zntA